MCQYDVTKTIIVCSIFFEQIYGNFFNDLLTMMTLPIVETLFLGVTFSASCNDPQKHGKSVVVNFLVTMKSIFVFLKIFREDNNGKYIQPRRNV